VLDVWGVLKLNATNSPRNSREKKESSKCNPHRVDLIMTSPGVFWRKKLRRISRATDKTASEGEGKVLKCAIRVVRGELHCMVHSVA
jgi:hypothetical protein